MKRSTKQRIIAVIFVCMLGFVVARGSPGGLAGIWHRLTGSNDLSGTAHRGNADPLQRYGFRLSESSRDIGIDFHHEATELDPKLAHIMPLVNAMGAAVSVVDFDSDGWLDLYVVTSKQEGQNLLYRNRRDGTFEDVAKVMGLADLNQPGTGACMGTVWADYDNDGYPDPLIYKWGRPELFHNMAGKNFERVSDRAKLPKWVNANAACWLDYDRDGRLDLFLAGYWSNEVNLWDLKSSRIMPESFEYAKNGGRKYLLHNLGDGVFEDVTEAMGIKSTRWTLGVAAADLCGTGYQDLILANDYGVSEFYANRNGERFEEVGYETGVGVAPKSGMSVSFGDVFNSGRLAVYITNITEPGNLVQGNNLWVPTGDRSRGLPRYLNQAGDVNVERGGWSWGAKFGDLNNDGWIDLYLTNGFVSADKRKSYWYDYGKIAGGLKGLIGDAKYWPPIGEQSLSGYQRKCVWLNKSGHFIDVASAVGATDVYDGRAVTLADLFNEGVLDVVAANQSGPLLVYRNTVAQNRQWVQFELEGGARMGRELGWSNRSAVGAEARITWQNGVDGPVQQQVQVVTAGDAFASQGMFRLHFGLGDDARIEQAVIRWPSGRTHRMPSPNINSIHHVAEADLEAPSS